MTFIGKRQIQGTWKDAFTPNNYELGTFLGQILQKQIVRMKKDEMIFPVAHMQ